MNRSSLPTVRRISAQLGIVAVLTTTLGQTVVAASSWSPTLLVNTESFQTIDDGDSTTDIEVRFGSTLNEKLYWDRTNSQFRFSDDLHVDGNLTASGTLSVEGATSLGGNTTVTGTLDTTGSITTDANLTINEDNGAADAVLTFGNDGGTETITFSDTNNRFDFSDDIQTSGNIEGSGSLAIEGAAKIHGTLSGNTLEGFGLTDCDADGQALSWDATTKTFVCGDDDTGVGTLTYEDAASYFVNDAGDTMTGALKVQANISGSSLNVDGAADINGSFDVQGAANFQSTLDTTGNITTDADLTINQDNGAADAVLTFGSDTVAESLTFLNNEDRFQFSDDVHVTGNITASGSLTVDGAATFGSTIKLNGVTYTFPTSDGSASGKVLKTDGAGHLVWSSDIDTDTNTTYQAGEGLSLSNGVFTLQEAITGATLSTTGNISTNTNLTINADNGDADAVLTFGNDAGAKAITYSNTNTRFEFNDDVKTTGNLSGSTLTVDGNVTLRGQTYSFPTSGGSSGQVLRTDGAGNLSWYNGVGRGSGGIVSLNPEYAGAVYFSSGSSAVGQLVLSGGTVDLDNSYIWTTTRTGIQDYWVSVRVRVPDNFSRWEGNAPITFRYKTLSSTASVNHITVRMLDTAGSAVALTGNAFLVNTSWTTATITGPQSAGTYTPGGYITLLVKLATTSSGRAQAGVLNLNWETSTQ